MTCVECGADMGTSKLCQRCGAPVVVRPGGAPSTRTAGQTASKPSGAWITGIVAGSANFIALWLVIAFIAVYVTEGSPGEEGQGYVPLWAVLFVTILCGSVPVTTVVLSVRWLRRRLRERRVLASDAPVLLPETLD